MQLESYKQEILELLMIIDLLFLYSAWPYTVWISLYIPVCNYRFAVLRCDRGVQFSTSSLRPDDMYNPNVVRPMPPL